MPPTTAHPLTLLDDPCDWIRHEYEARRARNPYYSQRAFSRFLGIPSGRLSELLARRRGISPRLARKLTERLGHTPEQSEAFLTRVSRAKGSRTRARKLTELTREPLSTSEYQELGEDLFAAVGDWHHWGLLNLLRTEGCRHRPSWMAQRLGIPTPQVREALERLERLGMLRRESGRWVRTQPQLRSTHDVPSTALKYAHKQCLSLASRSLDEVAVECRDISTMMMAIDMKRLPVAKEMIRNFRRGLAELLEQGSRSEVYSLTIALFPLSKRKARA